MSKHRVKKPNSLMHGGFSVFNILPGEDPSEFACLLFELHQEWEPDGPTETDAVHTVAKCMWRKARAQKFLELAWTVDRMDPSSRAYDEALVLANFAETLETQPQIAFEPNLLHGLRQARIDYFYKKFPLPFLQPTLKWCQAVANDIRTVLLPAFESGSPDQQNLALLMRTARTFDLELLQRELGTEERLDMMVDRAIKRLIQIKGAKQMIAYTKEERSIQPPAAQNRERAKSRKVVARVHHLQVTSLSVVRPEIGAPTMLLTAA